MLENLPKSVICPDVKSTKDFAKQIAQAMNYEGTIALLGDLGVGKTVFAKGLAEAMGVDAVVKSPSYNVCLNYEGTKGNFVHIDAYRLKKAADYEGLLIDEIVPDPKLICIEWASLIKDALPENTLTIKIDILPKKEERRITLF